VAPAFSRSADFAINKPAGQACRNLRTDFRCGIHTTLRQRGFPGCTVYDCFGAGQQVAQVTFRGRNWRASPELAQQQFHVFGIMRDLHELLWYLTEARGRAAAGPLHDQLTRAIEDTQRLTQGNPETVANRDVNAQRSRVDPLLQQVSELIRAGRNTTDLRGADLIGKQFRGADLRGANLRGAYLIGANLAEADLTDADLIGADLRGTNVAGTRLAGALFLTQFQVNAASGDRATTLPPALTRPAHWAA
jgi:uncharacterized protein YjbI with pentapeptide repeats